MSARVKVTIADQDGVVLAMHEVDIAALDRAVCLAVEDRGEWAAARVLNAAGSEVEDALCEEIKAAWVRFRKASGQAPMKVPT